VLVAQSCNLTYPGTDQKDCSSKPAQANSSTDPISKIDKKKNKKTQNASLVEQLNLPDVLVWKVAVKR
jgi:hypothetical protein